MSYSQTGEETKDFEILSQEPSKYLKFAHSSGHKSDAYELTFDKTGSSLKSEKVCHKAKIDVTVSDDKIVVNYEIRRLQKKAVEIIEHFLENDDIIDQTNYGYALKQILEDLWQYRDEREHNWGDLLNIIQTILLNFNIEILSKKQKHTLKIIFDQYLFNGSVTDPDIEQAMILLVEEKLDPFIGISWSRDFRQTFKKESNL